MTYTGYLQLEVGKKHDRSVISNSYFDGVFKITRPTYLPDGLPLLTLIHVGGGYVDGDRYKTEVTIGDGAKFALTTQASTKVYKCLKHGVSQEMDYFLGNESELFLKQDSLILYKNADFRQYTNVYMKSSSVFYYTEIVTPGWSADGLLFQYKKLAMKMKVYVDGRLEIFDHQLLQPCNQLENIMQLEGYSHIGTLFIIHKEVNDNLLQELRHTLKDIADVRVGISELNVKGLVIRILACDTPAIESIFSKCEKILHEKLYNTEQINWRKN
ncbi:urease accessory protein [Metabacillus crassostreae]|uniref:urease accessory protein UreD n=1 Tax=Metabacillus crassostreae TaxID=929098 RepID=UPI00195F1631|nr:urease accessory protein UreD [Metabacillus crassostreae]MBM7604538.1 urease accessory protein [Metabacillus crassostreae]